MKEKYQKYLELLGKWQKKINIVSSKTLTEAYERHIEDSLEISKYIKNRKAKIFDLGAGGGFPGLPLAIEGYENISLIESDVRKCAFMQQVKIAYNLDSTRIINDRVENIIEKADIITCRAFSSLSNIFYLTSSMRKKETIYVLLKGERFSEEIDEAKKEFSFDSLVYTSKIYKNIKVLVLRNVQLHV